MDDFNFDALDLGSRRKPTNWVAVAPPMVYRHKINPNKRCTVPISLSPSIAQPTSNVWKRPLEI
jgi:hypothetical protein